MSKTYPKIHSIYSRDPETYEIVQGQFSIPEFEQYKDEQWIFTEKIDGTNIRVIWDGNNVTFKGKKENSQIPVRLLKKLEELFPVEKFINYSCGTLYGEGFGYGIQYSNNYYLEGEEVGFILFDAFADDSWVSYEDIKRIADRLDIKCVDIVFTGTLLEGYEFAREGFPSAYGGKLAEGLIGRPVGEPLDSKGDRVTVKLRTLRLRKEHK